MAIPKKESRIITIDDKKYRWVVGPNDDYNYFYAQREGVEGQIIAVFFRMYTNKVGLPLFQKSNLIIIKPKEAESMIRQALQLGWDAEKKGPTLKFTLIGDKIELRKG